MPEAVLAGLWGLVAGSALLLGAALGYGLRVPSWLVATVMAFGAGVLISAVSFELVGESYDQGGLGPAVAGTLAGGVAYTAGNAALARRGARHRKRSGDGGPGQRQPSEAQQEGSGVALALGALLDGVPESAAIGVSLLDGGEVSLVTVVAVFLSNVPEGLSSSAGMRAAGRRPGYVFGVWGGIAAASTASAVLGYAVVGGLPTGVQAAVTAVAAGGILTMLADTMIPEAFARAHLAIGLVLVCGFLVSFGLSHA
ncbi:ZIP family zinc transporter [Streptomyces sp. DSM 44917]|uniref:ZIP family zinc transporter n=1 Tax=Streptomyces boetiae TaxID=3075541 RepID=A0ABU2L4W9_9ACTN|nr:ZIP family zinc transporter [Streptomyces sp. DSM 44917]MDT0306604.1 ZIP family zinc transporter [Streptomyces sp. DSM 44917]